MPSEIFYLFFIILIPVSKVHNFILKHFWVVYQMFIALPWKKKKTFVLHFMKKMKIASMKQRVIKFYSNNTTAMK